MHPFHHAVSSARRWGGEPADYLFVHSWFDESKAHLPDLRHRALRHHAEGIFLSERIFGATITNSAGREVPVRQIGEQHVLEDLGRIPTAADWLREIRPRLWMLRRAGHIRRETGADNEPAAESDELEADPAATTP